MTLHEIEETLHTLQLRHSALDEGMLVTLLRAGGWEEKEIEEAKALYRGSTPTANNVQKLGEEKPPLVFSPVGEEALLAPPIDTSHLLNAHNEEGPQIGGTESEPQSLVIEPVVGKERREELPHNLPLRPFETSEHIWPFSRYRDVFYGEAVDEVPTPPAPQTQTVVNSPVISEPVPHNEAKREVLSGGESVREKAIEHVVEKQPQMPEVHIAPVQFSKGDEKLVVMASVMLLIILLLLGYMYSNGRL